MAERRSKKYQPIPHVKLNGFDDSDDGSTISATAELTRAGPSFTPTKWKKTNIVFHRIKLLGKVNGRRSRSGRPPPHYPKKKCVWAFFQKNFGWLADMLKSLKAYFSHLVESHTSIRFLRSFGIKLHIRLETDSVHSFSTFLAAHIWLSGNVSGCY